VEASPRYAWIVLATVLFGLFAVGCTITVLAVAIPTIADDLHSDINTVSWVTTGPLLAFAVFGPALSKLADLRGQRRVYLLSLGGVAVFAALAAASWSAGALILFRVLGAAVGAATGPASLAIINRLFPREKRAHALGYWSMVGAGGPVIGALLGGPVVETIGWRWIFIAQAPITILTLAVAYVVLPDLRPVAGTEDARLDLKGAVALGGAAVALLLAVNRGPKVGWTHPGVVAGFVLAPVLLAAFVSIERRVAHPLLPLAYLRRRNFTFPIATILFTNFAYMGAFMITPYLLEEEFGFTVTHTTVLSIARPAVFAVAGPIAGYFTIRIGERSASAAGAVAIVVSMVGLAALAPGNPWFGIAAALGVSGLGMGLMSPALASAVANAVDDGDLGIAGAAQQMVGQVGASVGGQVMLAVQTARAGGAGAVAAYGDAYLVGGGLALVGVLTALLIRSSRHHARDRGAPEGAPASVGEPALAGATP
jgi:EmrB/QacA subfamily drug resistance transporter